MRTAGLLDCFFFNDTATTEIYPLSLHDALPICNWRFYPKLHRIGAPLPPTPLPPWGRTSHQSATLPAQPPDQPPSAPAPGAFLPPPTAVSPALGKDVSSISHTSGSASKSTTFWASSRWISSTAHGLCPTNCRKDRSEE